MNSLFPLCLNALSVQVEGALHASAKAAFMLSHKTFSLHLCPIFLFLSSHLFTLLWKQILCAAIL